MAALGDAMAKARLAAVEWIGHHTLAVEHLHLDINADKLRGEGTRDSLLKGQRQ